MTQQEEIIRENLSQTFPAGSFDLFIAYLKETVGIKNIDQEQAISIANAISPILNLPTIISDKKTYYHTGTTLGTIIGTPILIPANTIKQNDLVQVAGIFQYQNNNLINTNWNIKVYISPEPNISLGQVLYSPSNINTPNNPNVYSHNFESEPYICKDGNLIGSNIRGNGTSNYVLNSASYVGTSHIIFDPTIDNYLFATGILQNAGTFLTQHLLQIKIY